ncbi:MAG TPA: DoxX family membrane protein [Candidatus Acidoferrales bacterium]|nr:DoxX family membrane protein [Candidatus Acidoferrales bacterium]
MTIALAALRTLIGLLFVGNAITEFIERAQWVTLLGHWQLPHPEITVFVVAAVEFVCGALLMLGALVRPAALVLATIMVAMTATAGRVDGGLYLVVPPILFVGLVFYAWRSGRVSTWSPTRRPGTQ